MFGFGLEHTRSGHFGPPAGRGFLVYNDVQGSEPAAGIPRGLGHRDGALSLELRHRLSNHWSRPSEGIAGPSVGAQDPTYRERRGQTGIIL